MKLLARVLGLESVKELATLMAEQALEDLTHVRSVSAKVFLSVEHLGV